MLRIAYPKVFPFTLLTVLGLLVWWLNEMSNFSETLHKLDTRTPDLVAFQVVGTRFNQQGQPVSKLISSQLSHYQADDITWLFSPLLTYTAEDKAKVTISSAKAKLQQHVNKLFMYDKVELIREAFKEKPKFTVNTQNVLVDIAHETASSSSPILALTPNSQIRAVGFYFDNNSQMLSLHNQVKVNYVKEK